MESNIKIKFGQPRHLPTEMDGIEIAYPYKIIETPKEKYKLENPKSSDYTIKVAISGSLAITWGFEIWKSNDYYYDLIKLLLPYAIEEIKKKYKEGTLNKFEEIVLLTTNHPENRIYDIQKLPEVNNHVETINIHEDEKKIYEEIEINKLAGEIIQYRDLINAIIYNSNKVKLLELDQERNLFEFFKGAKTNEDFSHRIASLGALVGKLNKKFLKEITEYEGSELGTIGLLKLLVEKYDPSKISITEILRQINRLRQGYPIHSDKATGVIEAHEYFKIDYPITDFEKAWSILLEQYLHSLKELFELIKKNFLKK